MESNIKSISFEQNEMEQTEFVHVNLKGVDFSTNTLINPHFDLFSLKKIILAPEQSYFLAQILDVELKDN